MKNSRHKLALRLQAILESVQGLQGSDYSLALDEAMRNEKKLVLTGKQRPFSIPDPGEHSFGLGLEQSLEVKIAP